MNIVHIVHTENDKMILYINTYNIILEPTTNKGTMFTRTVTGRDRFFMAQL